jgi:hypothetical protein
MSRLFLSKLRMETARTGEAEAGGAGARGRVCTRADDHPQPPGGEPGVSFVFMRSILTEIYLCHPCSCQLRMELRMETPGKVRLGRLGPQSFFGELAIMSAQTAGDGGGGAGMGCSLRTRSVVSRAPCHFHVLTKHDVDELRAELPPLEHVSGADPSFVYIYSSPLCLGFTYVSHVSCLSRNYGYGDACTGDAPGRAGGGVSRAERAGCIGGGGGGRAQWSAGRCQ